MNFPRFLYAEALTHLLVSLSKLSMISVNKFYFSSLVHSSAILMMIYTQALRMAQFVRSRDLLW